MEFIGARKKGQKLKLTCEPLHPYPLSHLNG
jgi:hypothetical protein